MTATQYIGRKYDVMAYQGVKPTGMQTLTPALADATNPSGAICCGIQKLLQDFLRRFATKKGSKLFDSTYGTEFLTDLQQGYLRTELDVQTAFSMAAGDVAAQFAAITTDDTPDDERFADAILEGLELTFGTAALHIRVESVAGTSRTTILPLTVVI